jgi:hypothetical protein
MYRFRRVGRVSVVRRNHAGGQLLGGESEPEETGHRNDRNRESAVSPEAKRQRVLINASWRVDRIRELDATGSRRREGLW